MGGISLEVPIEGAIVHFEMGDAGEVEMPGDAAGHYQLLAETGDKLRIRPSKDGEDGNGVSTADMNLL